MPNLPISGLNASAANLASTDLLPVVQTSGVGPVKMTGLQLAGGLLGSTALTGATVTTSKPVLDLSQTWNAGAVTFTGLKFNATDTASASGSLLMDLQVGGVSKFSVSKSGATAISGGTVTTNSPVLDLSQTWNNSGVTFQGIKLNVTMTAQATASTLLELQVGGSRAFGFQYVTGDNSTLFLGTSGAYLAGSAGYAILNCAGGNPLLLRYSNAQVVSINSSSDFRLNSGVAFNWNNDTFQTRAAAATLQLGAADAAAPVAQTLQVQSVVAGTTNTAGANFTIAGSKGTGTGAGGSIIFQVAPAGTTGTAQNALATALTINADKSLTLGSTVTVPFVTSFSTPVFGTASTYLTIWNGSGNGISLMSNSGSNGLAVKGAFVYLQAATLAWEAAPNYGNSADLFLARDAANTLALRNGANAQAFNIYSTYTDASNYERIRVDFSSSNPRIYTSYAGTGAGRTLTLGGSTGLYLTGQADSALNWFINGSGHLTAVTDNTYDIGASGANRPRYIYSGGNIYSGGSVILGNGGVSLSTGQRGGLNWAADGVITLLNNSFADFNRLQFGGTTSSFPALKRSLATLQVRLADDSAYSNLAAAQLYSPPTALTSGATITWNANVSSVASLTLNDVGATLTMSNLVAGGTYLLIITQGTGGSKTITTWTNFKWAGGTAPVLSSTAGNIDVITAYSDGTYLYASAQIGFA